MDYEEKSYKWTAIGTIVGVLALIVTVFGFTLKDCRAIDIANPKSTSSIASYNEEIVNKQSDVVPTESKIKEQIQQKTGKVWIEDVTVLCHETKGCAPPNYYLDRTPKDNIGNVYEHALLLDFDDYAWASGEVDHAQELQLYLNGKYSTFSFDLALDEETKNTTKTIDLTILADDNKIWLGSVTGGSLPQKHSIDVSGVTVLSIKSIYTYKRSTWTDDANAILGNAYFELAE